MRDALLSRRITCGPLCRELESALAARLGVADTVVTTSGSIAVQLALLAHGVGPGDEVVVPALGFVATAHAALLLGASVRLADVCADRPTVDPDAVARALGPRTKAVVAVHLNGRAVDLDGLRDVTGPRGVPVVEDAAQAFCSRDRHGAYVGSGGSTAAFSLGLTKLITAGEGGFVATGDAALADKLRRLRNHGTVAIADNAFRELGGNFRLTDMAAALGLVQFARLDEKIAGVRRVYARYAAGLEGLDGVRLLGVEVDAGEVPLWTEVLCADREAALRALTAAGIQAKPFHPCLVESPHLGCDGEFPNASAFAASGLTLPSGPDQPDEDIDRVVEVLRGIDPAPGSGQAEDRG